MSSRSPMMNDTEPSPTQVAAFEDSLKDGQAKILFYNTQVTDDTTTRLLDARQASTCRRSLASPRPNRAGKTIQTWFAGQIAEVAAALADRTQ